MIFIEECAKLGYTLTNEQMNQFEQYYQFLIAKNEVMNLTTITDKEEVYTKHFLDSIQLVRVGSLEGKSILDVGSGAGFPSIPLKILIPTLKVTIIDALQKRIQFLSELTQRLGLEDITLIHGRAEEISQREQFDIVTSRAVAKLHILSELLLPFVKVGGMMVAMKSKNYDEEFHAALYGIRLLGGTFDRVIEYRLMEDMQLTLLVFKKSTKTPIIYPRQFSAIKKKPL